MLVLVLLGATSLAAVALGAMVMGLRGAGLVPAGRFVLEVVGAWIVFAAVNVLVGASIVVATRALTPWWVTFYAIDDVTLLVGSLLQALAFCAWRAGGGPAGAGTR